MTALKPIENTTRVRGVPSKRYPPNTICAHPECDKPVESIHHIFGRLPGPDSDSWFVDIGQTADLSAVNKDDLRTIIPHAIGLCGSGTTGHHGDIEEHRAWIKLEDGKFVWYDRISEADFGLEPESKEFAWTHIGPLNPQPGSVEGKPKRRLRKHGKGGPAATWSIRAPQDDLDAIDRLKIKVEAMQERFGGKVGPTVTIERCIDFVNFNAGPEDF